MTSKIIHLSYQNVYEYQGWLFQYDERKPFGPWPLKKDHEPKKLAGDKFYDMFDKFLEMSAEDREKYRI